VFQLKEAVGVEVIRARESAVLARVLGTWRAVPSMEILGNLAAERLSIVSFVVRAPGAGGRAGRYLHHNFVVALLNDLFGIQSRGGCSCAGPYGHRLLGIDLDRSHEFEREISGGCEGIKPGWVRVNVNYFVSDVVVDYLIKAVVFVAEHGWRLLGDYRFDVATGRWHHRAGPVEPPLRLGQICYDAATGEMLYPHHDDPVPESALAGYLDEAIAIVSATVDPGLGPNDPEPTGLSEDFERLRWFELPATCLRS
ncbi:MAG TPA: aminotransferase, partial [Microlunatus sp.]|nr:aminotransferase [Microlunatus sp.]